MLARKSVLAYLMWLLPLSFFSYQFILRLWPSLMMEQIMLQYTIDASSFGLLAAVYYYGYAGMQIPIAVALEKLGPRWVVALCALVCGLATFIFVMSSNWWLALLSRCLVGVGSAAGFLATSKVISQWFSKQAYSRMVGITFTGGLLGAIYGGRPISLMVSDYGWQQVALVLGGISCSIALLALLFLKSPQTNDKRMDSVIDFLSFKKLLSQPKIWLLAFANMLMVGALEGFADVWGVNYLMATYGHLKQDAAQMVSFIFVGMLFGGPILALLGKRLGNIQVIAGCGIGMGASLLCLLLSPDYFNVTTLSCIFFFIGILCCYQVIVFAVGCDFVDKALLGVTVAFLNSVNMIGGSFFHTMIGHAMDLYWDGQMQGTLKVYSHQTYVSALMMIPVCAIVGSCVLMFLAKQQDQQAVLTKLKA